MNRIPTSDFTEANLSKLKQLECDSYSGTNLSMMQHCDSWNAIADYCDCELNELRVYIFDNWYLLMAEHEDFIELVDLASTSKHTPLFKVLEIVEQYQKPFTMDCRETTSYRMIQAMEKAGRLEVHEDEAYHRDGEIFHEIEASLIQRNLSLAR